MSRLNNNFMSIKSKGGEKTYIVIRKGLFKKLKWKIKVPKFNYHF